MTDTPPPGIEAKLAFLRSPAAHGGCAPVECIETHMSWVLLCGEGVLKLKKPVRHAFLDFSTLAARERNVREELRLNRRLAPAVYLGVKALRWQAGAFSLADDGAAGAPGDTVDWLVHMRRLPAAQMLDRRLAAGDVTAQEIEALAGTLARFYRAAAPARLSGEEVLRRHSVEQARHRGVLLDPRFALGEAAAAPLRGFDEALAHCAPLLAARAARMVDGHGDLRPEHVCLAGAPVVIDCIEFNAALRQVDPFDELAFLGLECSLLGDERIGAALWSRCAALLGDAPPAAAREFYTAGRALLRARLMAAHLLDERPRTPERWLPRCRAYLAQAALALQRLQEA